MKSSILIKNLLSKIAYNSNLTQRRLNRIGEQEYLILMYHRVLPPSKISSWLEPGMYVTPETFEMQLRFLKNHFEILSLKEILTKKGNKNGKISKNPNCAITFDDGWLDTYEYAFPILKKFRVPATIFLTTDYIDSDKWFWTDRFLNLISQLRKKNPESAPVRIKLGQSKNDELIIAPHDSVVTEEAIDFLKTKKIDTIEQYLENIREKCQIKVHMSGRAFLNWNEVKELVSTDLIDIGSHTARHPILTTLTHDEITNELQKSKIVLMDNQCIDKDFFPFCYPNGNFTDKIASDVKAAGYNCAVTTKKGWNMNKSNPYTLNRIGIHQDITSSLEMFGARIAELF